MSEHNPVLTDEERDEMNAKLEAMTPAEQEDYARNLAAAGGHKHGFEPHLVYNTPKKPGNK